MGSQDGTTPAYHLDVRPLNWTPHSLRYGYNAQNADLTPITATAKGSQRVASQSSYYGNIADICAQLSNLAYDNPLKIRAGVQLALGIGVGAQYARRCGSNGPTGDAGDPATTRDPGIA